MAELLRSVSLKLQWTFVEKKRMIQFLVLRIFSVNCTEAYDNGNVLSQNFRKSSKEKMQSFYLKSNLFQKI